MKTKHTTVTAAGAILLLLNTLIVNAQWTAVRYDQYNIFHKVSAPTANTVFVTGNDPVGYQNFVLRTNDGGINWDSISFSATDTFQLTELSFINVNTGFVGGGKNGYQVLFKTNDNGTTWTEITPNPSSGNYITSVYFVNVQDGFATDGTILYQTTNGGISWTQIVSPFNIRDLYFSDMINGLASGDNNGTAVVMQTADGGQNWNTLLTATDPNLFVSSFAKLDVVDAYTFFTALENTARLYRSLDGGNSWQMVMIDSTDFIRDFDFANANEGHVLGDIGWGQEYRILLTLNGGQDLVTEYTTGWNFYGGGVVLNAFAFVEETGYTTGSNGLVKKYFSSATGISEEESAAAANVFPNPFSVSTTFRITNGNELTCLKIYDAYGREVFKSEIRGSEFELQRGDLPAGIYLYNISNGEILSTGKLLVTD